MNRKIAFVLCFCIMVIKVCAVPAYPRKVAVTIDGEIVYIQMHGDEHSKWAETEKGYSVVQDASNQWCYAVRDEMGRLRPSKHRLQAIGMENDETRKFLTILPRHIKPATLSPSRVEKQGKRIRTAAIGQRRVLIILMQFADLNFIKTQADFNSLFNQIDYQDDGAQGSVYDYYNAVSYGQLSLQSDIYGPYTASRDMSYYGHNGIDGSDNNPYALFIEGINQVAKETDLSNYDADGDGVIDNVHIIFAGYGEEAGAKADAIWSHEMYFGRYITVAGMKIDSYSCAPELRDNRGTGISRIGVNCHEIGHALGAMDFYDTDYGEGDQFIGTGEWDIMASGSWNNDGVAPADFNPYVKAYDYGWVTPISLPQGQVLVTPSNIDDKSYYYLGTPGQGDYYLLDNRSRQGWGAGLPGEGLLIFHIHQDINHNSNGINATAPQKCYPVCASSRIALPGKDPSSYGSINKDGCPFPGSSGNRAFGTSTTPRAFFWDGKECNIELSDITVHTDGSVSLVNNSQSSDIEPVVTERVFFDGFEEFPLKVQPSEEGFWTVVEDDENSLSVKMNPQAYEGRHSLQLSAESQLLNNQEDTFEFICNKYQGKGKMTISGYVASSGLRGRTNMLKIGYMFEGQDEWQYAIVTSTGYGRWEQFIIDLPNGVQSTFRIEGCAVPRSVLALDNLEVLLTESVTDVNYVKLNTQLDSNMNGICYSFSGIQRNCTNSGINVIQLNDGTWHKVISRTRF